MAQQKLSTGVLVRDPASYNAHVDILSLSLTGKRSVTVEIFDWGVDELWDQPVIISSSGPMIVLPNTLRSFFTEITESTAQPGEWLMHYEVRVTVSDIQNVVVNCFATDASGKVITGNTVLHRGLVVVT